MHAEVIFSGRLKLLLNASVLPLDTVALRLRSKLLGSDRRLLDEQISEKIVGGRTLRRVDLEAATEESTQQRRAAFNHGDESGRTAIRIRCSIALKG